MSKIKPSRRQHQGVTLADVARHAGVSPMTVSRVINTESNVREKTRQLVNNAIEELGYSPNQAARNLAGANQIRIGLLYSNPSASYLSAFLLGGLDQASTRHAQLVVEKCEPGEAAEQTAIDMAKSGVDGVLLPPPLSDYVPVLTALRECDIPTVAVAACGPQSLAEKARGPLENVSTVSIDDYHAAYTMTEYIISLGHTKIGFIVGNPMSGSSDRRKRGFLDAMHQAGIEVHEDYLVQGYFTYRSGLEAAQHLLELSSAPSAIFASNDDMAAATVAVAHRKGLDVPADLSVFGFDDTELAVTIWPELTTIHQPIEDMSRAAVDLVVDKIRARRNGTRDDNQRKLLNFTLVKRQSAAKPS